MLWHCWLGDVYRIWHVKTRCSIRQKVSFADRPDLQFLENNPVIQEPKVVVMNYEVVMILIWHILSPLLEWCGLLQDDVLLVRTCCSRAEACIMLIQCVNEIWLILDPNAGLQVGYFWTHKDAEFIGNKRTVIFISTETYDHIISNSVTDFQFQFSLVCFYTMVEVKWLPIIDSKLSSVMIMVWYSRV